MKKLFLAAIVSSLFSVSFSQMSSRPGGKQAAVKDSSGKGNTKPSVSISSMSNTLEVHNTTATPVTSVNNTSIANNNPSLTLDDLNKKVTNLESQINLISDKLQFQNMAFAEIVADNSNLSATPNPVLKIDHPLCNNNPKAKIFFSPCSDASAPIISIYYMKPYWYAAFSRFKQSGFQPYFLTEFRVAAFNSNMAESDPIYVLKHMDPAKGIANSFLTGEQYHIEAGDKFSFLIFQGLPDFNPAIYQRPSNQ
jgi:hypothetical protein